MSNSTKVCSREVEEPGLEARLFLESNSVSTSRKFCLRVKCNVGFYYMNRFKAPAEGFVFVSQRGDALPVRPLLGSGVLCWALGRACAPSPRPASLRVSPLINFRRCQAPTPAAPRSSVGPCYPQVRAGLHQPHPETPPGPQRGRPAPGVGGKGRAPGRCL